MAIETVIIGEREFTFTNMNAFDIGRMLLKLKSAVAPALEAMKDSGLETNIAAVLAGLDENVHENIIFPILDRANLRLGKTQINSAAGMNACFDYTNVLEFYELFWEVLKFNFSPFIEQITKRTGFGIAALSQEQAKQ